MKRSALRRTPPPRATQDERLERRRWLEGIDPVCAMAGLSECEGGLQGHHCITAQDCRKHGLEVWSKDNRIGLCYRHHRRHHSRHEPVPRSLLPGSVIEFAWKGDLLWLIERVYP